MHYATIADLEAAVADTAYEGRLPDTDAKKTRLLEDAERDVDQALGPGDRLAPGGLLFEPAVDLEPEQVEALARATCAQAVYRIEMGAEHFVRAQRESVSTRSFTAEGKLPMVGPAAWRELTYSDLLRLTAQTGGRGRARSAADVGWR